MDLKETWLIAIADPAIMSRKWDAEIVQHPNEPNWPLWKAANLERLAQGRILPYYGIRNGEIICEATAMLSEKDVQNPEGQVDESTVYLAAFRTAEKFQGKGYFSRLFRFMEQDLKARGYSKLTLGAEAEDAKNRSLYSHLGFREWIKSARERWPDGTEIAVDYYGKTL